MSPFVRPHAVRRADRMLARAVFFLALALYSATFVGMPENPDGEVEFQTTRSLWNDGSLAMGDTPEARAIVENRFDVREGSGANAGRYYSWFGVGQAALGLPFYGVGRALDRLLPQVERVHVEATHYGRTRSEYLEHLVVGWRNPLFGALTAWLVLLTARRLGASRVSSFVAALAYATCTFAWPQARSSLSDVQATLLLFGAFDLVLRFREAFERYQRPRRLQLVLFGALLGLAFLTRLVTAPAVAVLGVLLVSVLWRGRRIGPPRATWIDLSLAAVPAALGLLGFLWINQLRFGDPLESGYGAAVQLGGSFFAYPPLLGALGLFAAPGKGLLWLAPVALLAPFGVRQAWRADGPVAVFGALAFALAVIAPIVFIESWHGAWTYGPRYILPCLPVALAFAASGIDRLVGRPLGRFLVAGLCLLGLVTNVAGVLVDHMTHQDLALQAMRLEWPDAPGITEAERDTKRFERVQFDWRFAAPWAHWRILRHRLAGLEERFSVRELFFVDQDDLIEPSEAAWRDFRHLAWIDYRDRLGMDAWPVVLALAALVVAALVAAVRGFEPSLR